MEASNEKPASKLLLETEVTAFLRCSRARLRRLRLNGLLGYYRTCPITISEDDLADYISRAKINKRVTPSELLERSKPKLPDELLTDAEAAERYNLSKGSICAHRSRKNGLPYLRGRPPLIDAQDLVDYFEQLPAIKSEERLRFNLLKWRVYRATAKTLKDREERPWRPMTKKQRTQLSTRLKDESDR